MSANPHPTLAPAGMDRIMVYGSEHDTEGEVTLAMPAGKKLDHVGVQVKFFGRIDMVSFPRIIQIKPLEMDLC